MNARAKHEVVYKRTLEEKGVAQWWERSPPNSVARVRILDLVSYAGHMSFSSP